MRIATWNVNSLKARLDKVRWWVERASPDVLLMQETKLADAHAPTDAFHDLGYEFVHHGEGRWNGVAIASRSAIEQVVVNFGEPMSAPRTPPESGDDELVGEARMLAARTGGLHVVCVYAPNGRTVDSPFYRAKLAWFDRLQQWLGAAAGQMGDVVIGGDFNVAPSDADVWDPLACHGGTHVSPPERAAFERLLEAGFVDAYRALHAEPRRYSWWDYRAGAFQKNFGMRIDHLLLSRSLAPRVVAAEIDREARKGTVPSDHAPVVVDLDVAGQPFDAGWVAAELRHAARRPR